MSCNATEHQKSGLMWSAVWALYVDKAGIYQWKQADNSVSHFLSSIIETFQFTSKRHHGFPFSLTFFLNGIQVDRLSSCCEYKHRKGARLGGKQGYFGFVNVDRASPCYRYGNTESINSHICSALSLKAFFTTKKTRRIFFFFLMQ